MKKIALNGKVDIGSLPEIATSVALSESRKQQEVGGMICLSVAGTIAVYMMA